MANVAKPGGAVESWLRLPESIEKAIEGLEGAALDVRGGSDRWSIRESVHHLVEANLVASNIIVAALAQSGCTYDWSWVNPDAAWMRRVGYDNAPIRPALEALRALCRHISGLVRAEPEMLRREVRLLDAPGAELYTKTVEEILRQEVEHAREHLRVVLETRAAHGASSTPRVRSPFPGRLHRRGRAKPRRKTGRHR